MKMINLNIAGENQNGNSLGGDAWWNHYLAWLASTPRNWVELKMEPPTQNPHSHLRVIDTATPEELGISDDTYPTTDLPLWWTIIVLDGAPERMKHLQVEEQQFPLLAFNTLQAAEECFGSIIDQTLYCLATKPEAYVSGNWRDGTILGFAERCSSEDFVSGVAQACGKLNQERRLSWNQQFHLRAGTGRSIREAFRNLLKSKCDEHCVSTTLLENQPQVITHY